MKVTIMHELKNLIIDVGKRLYNKDLTSGTSGNISVRYKENYLITGSGTALGDLEPGDILLVNDKGESIESSLKASSEKMLHIEIYKKRPDINAIIHCHPPFCSSFATSHIELDKPLMAENILYFGKIPLAKYAMPSSDKLVKNTVGFFDDHDAVLMANHGIVIGGKDLKLAFYKLETAETFAKICLYTEVLGKQKSLSDDDIKDLENLKLLLKS